MSHAQFSSRSIRRQRNIDKHLAKGLCRVCSEKAVTKSYCEKHRQKHNEKSRKAYIRLKEIKLAEKKK